MKVRVTITLLLLLLLGLSPVLFRELLGASSLAFGLFFSVLLFTLLSFKQFIEARIYDYSGILISFLLIVYTFLASGGNLRAKSIASLFLLLFLLIAAKFSSRKVIFYNAFNKKLIDRLFFVLIFLLVFAYFSDYYLSKIIYGRSKGIFPFGEPSNFALFFGPFFLLYFCHLTSGFRRGLCVLAVGFLAVLINSVTLLVFVILALLIFVRFNIFGLFLLLPISLGGVYLILMDPYFLSRIMLTPDSNNLSVLFYMQGVMDAYNAFMTTNGTGLGFQMLGTQPPSEATERILSIMGQDPDGRGLSRQSGGFVAAKLVAEFGVVGFGLLFSYVTLCLRAFIKLRRFIRKADDLEPSYIYSLVFIYSASVEVFVRGTGYFSPSLFLFFIAFFVYDFYRKRGKCFASRYC